MANISEQLLSFVLSAEDVKLLNPEWQDEMIEDYLNILRNIATIAIEVDQQFIVDSGLEQLIFSNSAELSKNRVRINTTQHNLAELESLNSAW